MSIMQDMLMEVRRLIIVMTFNDDSSASRPPFSSPRIPSKCVRQFMSHILLSAETHTLPSGVAPFPGAETGTGARIRDVQATGTGANVTAITVDYSVGALNIPGYELPWEETPSGRGLLTPLTLEIDASNGASDQVRRAGDHGLHALLCAAHPERRHPEWRHPERRAPRVPEADAVLGRRGPAGRPAPAQGAAGEGHAGGEGGRSCLPHRPGRQALDRVLRLLSVGSKRFLTSKVDRSVTGLIARQQCCGPLHLPLSDVAVFAQSPFSTTGCATAMGEQPVKGLINPAAMGRLTVGEACTNLVWAAITDIEDVKCSGNWMWASKLEGEGAAMYAAGFEPWDVHVRDLLSWRITLEGFRCTVFVGGFSYADVLESARGWRTVGDTLLRLSSFDSHYL
ncbi:hypothetical protein WA577_000467 [Blastocystis sp. JDR]